MSTKAKFFVVMFVFVNVCLGVGYELIKTDLKRKEARTMSQRFHIELNEYQVANLKSLIEASGYGYEKAERNPLWVANTGDWIGQIYNLLPEVEYKPNATAEELAERAREFQ